MKRTLVPDEASSSQFSTISNIDVANMPEDTRQRLWALLSAQSVKQANFYQPLMAKTSYIGSLPPTNKQQKVLKDGELTHDNSYYFNTKESLTDYLAKFDYYKKQLLAQNQLNIIIEDEKEKQPSPPTFEEKTTAGYYVHLEFVSG